MYVKGFIKPLFKFVKSKLIGKKSFNSSLLSRVVPCIPATNTQIGQSDGDEEECSAVGTVLSQPQPTTDDFDFLADTIVPEAVQTKDEPNCSLICCFIGCVDGGKSKLIDCIQGSNVQIGDAARYTQQIDASYFPAENLLQRTLEWNVNAKLEVPGLLLIDTPGHEAFTNLRSRGSGFCDVAILVVDIMRGLEPQTIESLNLLKMRNTQFIVTLNKVDELNGWKTCHDAPILEAIKQQSADVVREFCHQLRKVMAEFRKQGIDTEFYHKNKEIGEAVSIVPTSAISGEGIPDFLSLLVQWTRKTKVEKPAITNDVQCTILDVNVTKENATIDVVLVNGILRRGDQILMCGSQGFIVTTIQDLLTPQPTKELRAEREYLSHEQISGARSVKILAQGLEFVVSGTGLYVVGPEDNVDTIKQVAIAETKSFMSEEMNLVLSRINESNEGVYLQASSLWYAEALLEFLKSPGVKIPVSCVGFGPLLEKHVKKASLMVKKKREFAVILAFDVKVTPEAHKVAAELGIKIITEDFIYTVFDRFKPYMDILKAKQDEEEVIFPCKMEPIRVFHSKDYIVLLVCVLEGIVKVGTPICIPEKNFLDIGRVAKVIYNNKHVDYVKRGHPAYITLVAGTAEEKQNLVNWVTLDWDFKMGDKFVSRMTRRSIDILKAHYVVDDLCLDQWRWLLN